MHRDLSHGVTGFPPHNSWGSRKGTANFPGENWGTLDNLQISKCERQCYFQKGPDSFLRWLLGIIILDLQAQVERQPQTRIPTALAMLQCYPSL